jgi:hypothetical protein
MADHRLWLAGAMGNWQLVPVATLDTVVLEITRNPRTRFDRKNSSELLLWARKRQQRQLGIILWEGQFLKKGAIFDRF